MLSSKFLPISSHAAANALRWAFFHAARVPSPSAAAQSAVTSSNGTTSTFVVRVMQRGCIDEFYMENFSIRDLADACSMSESHFRRVFRELVGMGPLDYLNRTRIAKACSLLRMTDDSILTISEKVGFGSMSSFNRHFYEVMGTAPSDWRRATGTGIGTSILKYSGWLRPPTP